MKVVNKILCKYCRNPCNISWENLPAYSRVHKNLFPFFMTSKKDVILPQVGVGINGHHEAMADRQDRKRTIRDRHISTRSIGRIVQFARNIPVTACIIEGDVR